MGATRATRAKQRVQNYVAKRTAADVECIVVGAGVIGLAVARALAVAGREVFVLEADEGIGRGISSRNSEVIHAGLYYRPGSDKARCCIDGKRALYAFCEERGVPHKRCGKIIIATNEEQHADLEIIRSRAQACGVHDLRWLTRYDLQALEPDLRGSAGLFSPTTGIVDSHALMSVLEGDITSHGGSVVLSTPVVGGRIVAPSIIELATGGADPSMITARHVIIAGGLFATKIASSIQGIPPSSVPRTYFAKGNYFALKRRAPFSRLVYPVPVPGGLGVHLTIDLAGRARFGPDIEWLDIDDPNDIDYHVDPQRKSRFVAAIRTYWRELDEDDLEAAYSGVRPKLVSSGQADADFMIQTSESHGVMGLVALYGLESPGLTSALTIAARVAAAVSCTAR